MVLCFQSQKIIMLKYVSAKEILYILGMRNNTINNKTFIGSDMDTHILIFLYLIQVLWYLVVIWNKMWTSSISPYILLFFKCAWNLNISKQERSQILNFVSNHWSSILSFWKTKMACPQPLIYDTINHSLSQMNPGYFSLIPAFSTYFSFH